MTWFEKNREFYLKEKQFVSKYYPGLTFDDSEKTLKLKGQFAFIAEYEELETLKNIYEIQIVFPKDYPKVVPKVYEVNGKIDSFHRNKDADGSLCLGVPSEVHQIFSTLPNLKNFFDNLLIPFLYSHTYSIKYNGKLPWGERVHGGNGIIQYYKDKLNTENIFGILDFLEMSLQKKYRGHVLCPCGSNKKLRNCHIDFLKEKIAINNELIKYELEQIYYSLMDQIKDKKTIKTLKKRIKLFLNKSKKLCK